MDGRYCWYRGNSGRRGAQRVKTKHPNPWGLYDMSGNVSEWCYDVYSQTYYSESPVENPMGPDKGLYRVIRGGSWSDSDDYCMVYTRVKSFDIDRGYDNVGFRLIRPVNKAAAE